MGNSLNSDLLYRDFSSSYLDLQIKIEDNIDAIEQYLSSTFQVCPPLYSSVDLRVASFKLAPVDTNIFPAGFGLLDNITLDQMSIMIADYLREFYPKIALTAHYDSSNRVLLVHENFSRNSYYAKNIAALSQVLSKLGPVNIISIDQFDRWFTDHETSQPTWILLNADLTKPSSNQLFGTTSPILPSIGYGWYRRSKFRYFQLYHKLAYEVAEIAQVDPWLFTTYVSLVEGVDFRSKSGLDKLAKQVDEVIEKVQIKYDQYGISHKPSVFLKPDCGTFGMGIMVAHSGQEVLEINKKKRHSMYKIRDGVSNNRILIQESVPTNQYSLVSSNHETIFEKSGIDDIETKNDQVNFSSVSPTEMLFYNIGYNTLALLKRTNPHSTTVGNLNTKEATIQQGDLLKEKTVLQGLVNLMAIYGASLEISD